VVNAPLFNRHHFMIDDEYCDMSGGRDIMHL